MSRNLLVRAALLLARMEDIHVWSYRIARGQATENEAAALGRIMERADECARQIREELDRTAHEVAAPVKSKPRRRAA